LEGRTEEMKGEDLRAGRQPVLEVLKAGKPLTRIWIARGVKGEAIAYIRKLAREQGVPVQEADAAWLDRLAEGANHQGVVAQLAAQPYVEVEDLLQRAREKGEPPFLVALDGIEDPQNLGGILRTAEAVGAHGVIITRRRSAQLTAAAARAAAGALDLVAVARVSNLAQTLEGLKQQGCWVIGASADASSLYSEADYTHPLVLVIGGEGRGLRSLTRQKCDFLVRLPMRGQISSLNASVAAGILFYEVLRQRREKMRKTEL